MSRPVLDSLEARTDLTIFGDNALLLYALEMRFGIQDIVAQAANCLTDDSRDKKCDALYIDRESGTAVIAQAWFSKKQREHAGTNKAGDLNTAIAWVLGGGHPTMSESLRSASDELEEALRLGEIQSLEVWFCHNVPESDAVELELSQAAASAIGQLKLRHPEVEIPVRHLEVGINRLSEWYTSIQSPILVSDRLTARIDGWFEEVGTDWTAICTSVPATWLTGLYAKYEDRLFSANVRGYMPSRRTARNINHNIEKTAAERPGHFWAFNNGVTALVHDYEPPKKAGPGGELEITGMAIVNGAQTTGALSRSAKSPESQLDDATVMIRFVRCDDSDIVDDIIRFNNSQNPIKPSDFRSTDVHQERLRKSFDRIPDATYLGARRGGSDDRARRPSNLIPSDTAAQALAAVHGEPNTAYNDLRSIWERDEVYSRFFSDFTTAPHIVYCYSLLSTVQDAKAALATRAKANGDEALPEDDRDVLSFLRQRGSTFLLVSAISYCSEIYIDKAVPDKFKLSFGKTVSPNRAKEIWSPIVEVSLPFASQLQAAVRSGALRSQEVVSESLSAFRAVVRSTAKPNESIFSDFRMHVERDS